jgi:hypothetical protein
MEGVAVTHLLKRNCDCKGKTNGAADNNRLESDGQNSPAAIFNAHLLHWVMLQHWTIDEV